MAYFKSVLRRTDRTKPGKYYPSAVVVGRVTTDELCDEIAEISTVSPADVVAVLKALNRCVGSHLSRGESVQLKGLCNIRLTALSKGEGVDSPEKVSADQITGYHLIFSAERQGTAATGKGYSINLNNLRWRPLPGTMSAATNSGTNGSGTGEEPGDNGGNTGGNGGGGGTTPPSGGDGGEDQ